MDTSDGTPLCFVLMPFGSKPDSTGGPPLDFDRIYGEAIEPAIRDAGLRPVRADREVVGGIIHKPMFERLLLCDFAVADLTTANANVFYELGVRHATRPRTTLPIFAQHHPILFDVNLLRALPYETGRHNQFTPEHATRLRAALAQRLRELKALTTREGGADSPLFQLLQGYKGGDLQRLKTDVFRERVEYAEQMKERLAEARQQPEGEEGIAALQRIEAELGPFGDVEMGVLVDLFLSYRAVGGYEHMTRLYDAFPETAKRTVLLREQFAFALNRLAGLEARDAKKTQDAKRAWRARERCQRAVEVLKAVEDEHGASSETCGLLGRIYKDQWEEAREANRREEASAYLSDAIDTYVRGFESDWRDAYPGINACTLLDVRGMPGDLEQRDRLLPVVRFAVEQRLKGRSPDYWDHATLLELAVLAGNEAQARNLLGRVFTSIREYWEPETTARNLRLIADARRERGVDVAWLQDILGRLTGEGEAGVSRLPFA